MEYNKNNELSWLAQGVLGRASKFTISSNTMMQVFSQCPYKQKDSTTTCECLNQE
jgi:hypothetical protein